MATTPRSKLFCKDKKHLTPRLGILDKVPYQNQMRKDIPVRTPRQIATKLNDHHVKTSAGFYLSNGQRCFRSRVRAGGLEVMTWLEGGEEHWMPLDLSTTKVYDHNGREISL